jgi:hypothetical protein
VVSICVPVLNRYDLLERLLDSLSASTVRPTSVVVLDNGQRYWRPRPDADLSVTVFTPTIPLGVAASWNWFIKNTPEPWLITNDDILFGRETVEKMLSDPADFVSCGFGFSCFLLRQACVDLIGLFDEEISPGYAYYEDRDYYNRMQVAGLRDSVVHCGAEHGHSQTLAAFTPQQQDEHQKRFAVAQQNFVRKWGESPWSPSLSRL